MKEAERAIYSNEQGKSLHWEDLQGSSGAVDFDRIGEKDVTDEVRKLHRDGREATRMDRHDEAIALLRKAHMLAPEWPYATFDLANAYLWKKDWQSAQEYYAYTDHLAPGGFFFNKMSLHTLSKAFEGKFPPGVLLAYLRAQWQAGAKEQLNMLQQISEQFPGFAPVWARIAHLQRNPKLRLTSIEHGLQADPDADTLGDLLVNKALILHYSRKTPEAIKILSELILEENSTLATRAMAKMALSTVLH